MMWEIREQVESMNWEAWSLFYSKEYAKAITAFQASYDLSPTAQALRGIGEAHSALGQDREAILYLAASCGLRPNPRVSFDLAEVLFRAGHLFEAREAAERALKALPHYKRAAALLETINQQWPKFSDE